MRKLFLIVFLFICGATFYYIDPMKLFSIVDGEIKDLISSDFDLEIKEEGDLTEDYAVSEIGHINEDGKKTLLPTLERKMEANSTPSLNSILDKYESTLTSLKAQVEEKLEQLMDLAYEEYTADKQEDGNANLPVLYFKYKKAIDELEENTDNTFQEVYEKLKDELQKFGYDLSEADKVKEQYENIKKETRAVMMDRVMDKFEV